MTHAYPEIGRDIGAARVIKQLTNLNHKIILYTMRDATALQDAIDWFTSNDIMLYGINHNSSQSNWTQSPKISAHLYIDDESLGVPLITDPMMSHRPYVDWDAVEQIY